jgi:putative phosphoribosyl transferase
VRSKQVSKVVDLGRTPTPQPVEIEARPFALECTWMGSEPPRGLVILANAVSRADPASPLPIVSMALQRAGFGVLMLSSTAAPLATDPMTRFETGLLAARLVLASDWLRDRPQFAPHTVGCIAFGPAAASTLLAAAERPSAIRSLVAVDPRPGLVEQATKTLTGIPTLMIVGKYDREGILEAGAARHAFDGVLEVRSVPGRASAPSRAAARDIGRLAQDWFGRHLR